MLGTNRGQARTCFKPAIARLGSGGGGEGKCLRVENVKIQEQAMMTKNVDRTQRLLAVIDKQLAGKHFIHGDSLTAADIMLGSLLAWLQIAMPEVRGT